MWHLRSKQFGVSWFPQIGHKLCYPIYIFELLFYFFSTSVNFCCLLISFTNSLDPDQARQNVGPDLASNCLTLTFLAWKHQDFVIMYKTDGIPEKHSADNKKACSITQYAKNKVLEPRHEISNSLVCATSKGSDQPAHRPVWSEPLLVAWVFYDCWATHWTPFWAS